MNKKNPNILILSAYDVGGASIAAIRLHLGLLGIGANSKLLTLHKTSTNIPEHYQYTPSGSWGNKIALKFRKRREYSRKNSLLLPENKSLSGEFSMPIASYDVTESELWAWANVVNLHWVNEWIGLENLLSKCGSKQLIWTMHDMHVFTGGCHYAHECLGYLNECKDCPMLKQSNIPQLAYQFWKAKKAAFSLNPPNLTITAPSMWMANLAKNSTLLKDFNAISIPNSLDTNIFTSISKEVCRTVLQIPQDKIVLLSVIQSLSDRRKAFDIFLGTIQTIPNPEKFILCTVGHLKDKIQTGSLKHIHLGSISDERLMAIVYNCADIFVHPAIEDNFPNVVIEALSCGIPVAGFKIGGMPEMVQQGINGILSEEIGSQSLSKSISEVLSLNLNKDAISKNAHENYGLKVQANRIQQLAEELLNQN